MFNKMYYICSNIWNSYTWGLLGYNISSTGLSSINTKLSIPILISFTISMIFWCLGSQFALNDIKSSYFSILFGGSKPSWALLKSFLEHTANVIPRCFNSLAYFWKDVKVSVIAVSVPIRIPSKPSSSMTPPQQVLSKSKTKHFFVLPTNQVVNPI